MTNELRAKFDLFPCPFCGGDATIAEQTDEDGRFAAVVCLMCGAGSRQHYFCGDDAREHVADAWNERAAHASRDAEVEALKVKVAWMREYEKGMNRRAEVEEVLFDVARGKRAPLSADECRELAIKLGCTPK